MENAPHIPVLLTEVLDHLACNEGGVFIDGTFGAGGYTRGILDSNPANQVIGFDRDPDAIKTGLMTEGQYPNRFSFIHDCFGNMASHCFIFRVLPIVASLKMCKNSLSFKRLNESIASAVSGFLSVSK